VGSLITLGYHTATAYEVALRASLESSLYDGTLSQGMQQCSGSPSVESVLVVPRMEYPTIHPTPVPSPVPTFAPYVVMKVDIILGFDGFERPEDVSDVHWAALQAAFLGVSHFVGPEDLLNATARRRVNETATAAALKNANRRRRLSRSSSSNGNFNGVSAGLGEEEDFTDENFVEIIDDDSASYHDDGDDDDDDGYGDAVGKGDGRGGKIVFISPEESMDAADARRVRRHNLQQQEGATSFLAWAAGAVQRSAAEAAREDNNLQLAESSADEGIDLLQGEISHDDDVVHRYSKPQPPSRRLDSVSVAAIFAPEKVDLRFSVELVMDNYGFVAGPASDDDWVDTNRTLEFARNLSSRIVREISQAMDEESPWDLLVAPAVGAALYPPTPNPTPPPSSSPTDSATSGGAAADGQRRLLQTSSLDPSRSPTLAPSYTPTFVPSMYPSEYPTRYPSLQPTRPSPRPTQPPSIAPSPLPTPAPSQPSAAPSRVPTSVPSSPYPTPLPSYTPSFQPTHRPSRVPTPSPTLIPSPQPSETPHPSTPPTQRPTHGPTLKPSHLPTQPPTTSAQPTLTPVPSTAPSNQPTVAPTTLVESYTRELAAANCDGVRYV